MAAPVVMEPAEETDINTARDIMAGGTMGKNSPSTIPAKQADGEYPDTYQNMQGAP